MACPYCSGSEVSSSGDGWKAICGRAELALRHEPDNSFDAIVTDPPYAAGANSLLGRLQASSSKYQNSNTKNRLPDIAGDSMLPESWKFMMQSVVAECYRVAKPGADVLSFCDWRSLSSFLDVYGAAGFQLKSVLPWNKGRGCRPHKNGFRSQSELIIWARKGGKLDRPGDPVYLDGVFTFPTRSVRKQHLTEKPLELMAALLRVVPAGGRVLDPFHGSGTTGVAALPAGLTYLGIEQTTHYHATAVERLQAALPAASAVA